MERSRGQREGWELKPLLFIAGGDFFFFSFKIDWSPSLFLGGEHYFKPFGRLWVSPGHPVLRTARPFWRGSKRNPAPAAFSPHRGERVAEGCCSGLTTPAGFQPEGDANQPPSVIFAKFPPRSIACKIPGLLPAPFWGFTGFIQKNKNHS